MPYYKVVEENGNKALKDYSKPSAVMPSYIGMLDISTTNSTLSKVRAIYGADTNWIQHSGYVLRGATSGVVANSATKTGGSDNAVVVKHGHSVTSAHGQVYTDYIGGSSTVVKWAGNVATTGAYSNPLYAQEYGEDGTNKNIPNYKSVYIWERIH